MLCVRVHSGDGCDLASTLCKYDLRKSDLFVLSWATVRRVRREVLCFVQAKTLCRYGCMYFLAALVPVGIDVMHSPLNSYLYTLDIGL